MARRTTKLVLHAAAAVLTVAALGLAVGAWRLSQGPIAAGFLAPYLEAALEAEYPQAEIGIGDLAVTWGGGRFAGLRAFDVEARMRDGSAAARAPETGIVLSLWALARGVPAPRSVDIAAPIVSVFRRAGEDAGDAASGVGALRDWWREAQQVRDGAAPLSGALRRIAVSDALVVIHHGEPAPETALSVPRLVVERRGAELVAAAELAAGAGGEAQSAAATARYDTRNGAVSLRADIARLVPASLAQLVGAPGFAGGAALPLSGEAALASGPDGTIGTITFDLTGGAGTLSPLILYAPGTSFAVDGVRLAGKFDFARRELALDRAEVDFSGPSLAASGTVGVSDPEQPHAILDIVARGVPLDELDTYWPHEVLPRARQWAVASMVDGALDELALRMNVSGDEWEGEDIPADRVVGSWKASGATVRYHDELPPALRVEATAQFDAAGMTVEIVSGAAGPAAIHGGSVDIRDGPDGEGRAIVAAVFSSDLREALAVIDRPPLEFAGALGIEPDWFSGAAKGDLTLRLPLTDNLDPARIGVSGAVEANGVAVALEPGAAPMGIRGLDDGAAVLSLDREGFDLSGSGSIEGVPAQFHWRERFRPAAGAPRREAGLSAALDAAAREALGLGFDGFAGSVAFEGALASRDDGALAISIDIAADEAELDLPALRWKKPAGVRAAAAAALTLRDGAIAEIPRFRIDADGLLAAGSAARTADGSWRARLDRAASGNTDISGALVLTDGAVSATLRGRALDLTTDGRFDGGAGAGSMPFSLSAEVESLRLDGGLTLSDATVELAYDGALVERAEVLGALEGGAPLAARLWRAPDGGARVLTVETDNAGQLFAAAGVTPNMTGGRLELVGEIDDDAAARPVRGVLKVADFRMTDAPLMAQLLNITSIVGAIDNLRGDGIAFERLELPWAYRDGALTLERGVASGPALGLSMDGTVDFRAATLDVEGNVVPFNMIDRAVGALPVVGALLTGGTGSGVFAAPWRVAGAIAEPTVTANPLAMLAPGPLREMLFGAGAPNALPQRRRPGRRRRRRPRPSANYGQGDSV